MSVTLAERFAADTQAVLEPLDLDQYYTLMRAGVIIEGAPIELLDGLLIRKDRRDSTGTIYTVGPRHVTAINRVAQLLRSVDATNDVFVRTQQPIHLDAHNAPEPDLCVVFGTIRDFTDRHPEPSDVALVIEVADSSVGLDLGRKQELYRDAGVAEYWVVNLQDDVIHVFRQPRDGAWTEEFEHRRGASITTAIGSVAISLPVDAILGR